MARSRKKPSAANSIKEPLLFDTVKPRSATDLTTVEYEMLRSLGIEEAMSSLEGVPPREIKRLLRSNAGVAYLRQRIAEGKAKGGLPSIAEIRAEDQALLDAEPPVSKAAKKARGIRPAKGSLFPGDYADLPLPNTGASSPELVSVKGQLPLENVYERAEALRSLEGATRAGKAYAKEAKEAPIRRFADADPGRNPMGPEGPPLPPFPQKGMSPEEAKRARDAALRSISEEQIGVPKRAGGPLRLPKGKWQKAGLLKGLGGKAGKIGRGVGFGIGAAALALEGVDLLQGPAEGIYDYFTKDPVEEQAKMLRAREQLIRERQRQQEKSRETQRLRMINMQKIAQLNPQLAMELSVGRILPKGAAVIGGKPRTDALDAIADAMAEGTLDPSVPDPLSGVM